MMATHTKSVIQTLLERPTTPMSHPTKPTFSEQLQQLRQRLRNLAEHGPGPHALASANAALTTKLLVVSAQQCGMPPDEAKEFVRQQLPPFDPARLP